MKERKGPFGTMVGGIVDSVVQTARRRAQDREPRALLYDSSGLARMVRADAPGGDALVTTAGKLIELVGSPARDAAAEEAAAEAAEAEAEAETETEAEAADADETGGETPV